MASTQRHAVVTGASLAGVLAARALTATFDKVTLVDRDRIPHEPVNRGGVPQGRHTHGLLARGCEVIEELFPGTVDDLVARGAELGDVQADVRWHFGATPLAPGTSGLRMLGVSRPLLEWYLRRRLLEDPRVELVEGTSVLDLAFTGDNRRVNGVIVTESAGHDPHLLPARLVVDASGRTSRLPEWLERRGYPAPEEEVRRVDKHSTTRTFRRVPGPGPLAIVVPARPGSPHGGVMVAEEGDRWTVTLNGLRDVRPPSDLSGFLDYARSLGSPAIADTLAGAAPLDDGMTYRFPANRRRHYERLTEFPDGLLATGDSLCAFDPVLAQGMTVAALEARDLGVLLAEHGDGPGLARRFHARAATHIDTPWSLVTDVAPRPVAAYRRRLLAAAQSDAVLAAAFLRTGQLVGRPTDLLRPRIVLRVARAALAGVSAGSRPEPAATLPARRAAPHG
jgi:2-polyprenyl-6-methoxyphenol hydroxylase-like FAD-dependent oxidoreductase